MITQSKNSSTEFGSIGFSFDRSSCSNSLEATGPSTLPDTKPSTVPSTTPDQDPTIRPGKPERITTPDFDPSKTYPACGDKN